VNFSPNVFGERKQKQKQGKRNKNLVHYVTQESNSRYHKIFRKLTKEERTELKELHKKDPKAFRKKIQLLVSQYTKDDLEARRLKAFGKIVKKYKESDKEDEKEKILQGITEKLRKQFHKKIASSKAKIIKIEKRLEELKRELKQFEDNSETIIQQKRDFLLK